MPSARYDVYIENGLADEKEHLSLIRFPAMRSQFENTPDTIKLQIKPKSKNLKLEVSLDVKSKSYCLDRAQALAAKSTPQTFVDHVVDKNFYTSTTTPINDGQLFVCQSINDKLVCRPLSNIQMLRPDFTHLDLEIEGPKEEVRPVVVKFAGPDRQGHGSSAQQQQRQQADEPPDEFQTLNYKSISSREAVLQRSTLFGERLPKVKPDPDASQPDVKPYAFKTADVKPKIEKIDSEDIQESTSETKPNIQSGSPENSNDVKLRVKECLLRAKIVSFKEIRQYIKGYGVVENDCLISDKDLLDALNELALLVQGSWAVKSEILYGDSSERNSTDLTGISINLFINARDYLLWLFTQDRIVSRLEYSKRVKIPDHDILGLFNQLATFRQDLKKWELKLPTDEEFLERFPEVVQRQATFWKVRRANKLSIFSA